MTRYVDFIREWAQKNNKSYMCAATDPRAREEYYGSYPKRPTKSKLKQNREKQTAAVMGLMDMGAKAKESAAAKAKEDEQKERQRSAASDLMSMGSKAVAAEASTKAEYAERAAWTAKENAAIKARKEAKKATAKASKAAAVEKQKIAAVEAVKNKPAADLARAREALINPAAGVLTNPDLLRMIGSFMPKATINRLTKTELVYLNLAMAAIKHTADGKKYDRNFGVDVNGKLTILDVIKNSELPKQGKGGELNFNKINEVLDTFLSPNFTAYVYHSGGMGNKESVKLSVNTTKSRMPNVVAELKKASDKFAASEYDKAKVKENSDRLRAIRNVAIDEKNQENAAKREAAKAEVASKGAAEPDIDKYTSESLVYAIRKANELFKFAGKEYSNGFSGYSKYKDETPSYIIRRLKDIFKYDEPDVKKKDKLFVDSILRMGKMTKKQIKDATHPTLRGYTTDDS